MSTTEQSADAEPTSDSETDPTVAAFTTAFPSAISYAANDSVDYDAPTWIADRCVSLLHPDATKHGYIQLSDYSPAEYVRTDSLGDDDPTRCYGFTADGGNQIHWVKCEYVRKLANEVFGCGYDDMKESAHTLNDDVERASERDDDLAENRPVLFQLHGRDYRVVIAPYIGPNE